MYFGVVALVWWKQDSLLYFPERDYIAKPERVGLRYEDVWLRVGDGVRVHGWLIPAGEGRGNSEVPRTARASVLYFHGNGGNISNVAFFLAELHDVGFETLAIDYEGYGESEGIPSERHLYRDADAAWDWLAKTHGVPAARVIVWGHSLGGGVAAECGERHSPGAVVLESTFTNVPDVGAGVYWWLPVHLLASSVFPNRERVAKFRSPVLVAHGRQDEVIPYAHGRELFDAAHDPKRWLELRGGHNDGFDQTPGAWDVIDDFLAAAGVTAAR